MAIYAPSNACRNIDQYITTANLSYSTFDDRLDAIIDLIFTSGRGLQEKEKQKLEECVFAQLEKQSLFKDPYNLLKEDDVTIFKRLAQINTLSMSKPIAQAVAKVLTAAVEQLVPHAKISHPDRKKFSELFMHVVKHPLISEELRIKIRDFTVESFDIASIHREDSGDFLNRDRSMSYTPPPKKRSLFRRLFCCCSVD